MIDIKALVAAEEKRRGVGSKEFKQRHREIMELIDKAERRNHGRNEMPYNGAH